MNTDITIAEVQERTDASPQDAPEKNQYKIFDYFKDHTGLLVTCVSALVAIMSFIFHFAVDRMNYAYLEYWDIASLHANINNHHELYTVVCTLLYLMSLMVVHGLLSKTSDAFRDYNKLLSRINRFIKQTKKTIRRRKKEVRVLLMKLEHLSSEKKTVFDMDEIQKEIDKYEIDSKEELKLIKTLNKDRKKVVIWIILEITLAIVFSYLIGSLFLLLMETGGTVKEIFQPTWRVVYIIIVDTFIYFLPAYFASRCSRKQFEKENAIKTIKELITSGVPEFPIEKFAKKGMKYILSDKNLKIGAIQIGIMTMILILLMSPVGAMSAEKNRSFPIYTDGSTSYAIVYISDSAMFMEEATEKDGTLIIDTTKQRIVTSEDISYDMVVFDDVSVIKNDDTLEFDRSEFSVKDVVDAVESFFETLTTKIQVRLLENKD